MGDIMLNKWRFFRLTVFALVIELFITAVVVVSTSTTPDQTTLPTQAALPSVPTLAPDGQAATQPEAQTVADASQPPTDRPAVQAAQPVSAIASTVPVPIPQTIPTDVPLPPAVIAPSILATAQPLQIASLPDPVPNQVVIQFKPDAKPEDIAAYVASIGGTVNQQIDALNTVVVNLPTASTQSLPPSSIVAANEPDYFVSAQINVPPNDPLYPQSWALPAIGAPAAWQSLPADAPKVAVAVIDSGICADHPDLQGRILPGWDFVENDGLPQDEMGHGCGVAGIIAANIDDGIGMAGVAPNAMIMPLRVLDAQGIGTYSDVAAALVHAADNGTQVINLSLGGAHPSSVLEEAVNYAVGKGVTVVAAAGNTGGNILYPAAYEPVIAVGSVDQNLQRSSFSAHLPQLDLLAPDATS